jgi:4-hydroxy-tetrahydrodipicolinate synthase
MKLRGIFTAIVTPMHEGEVDVSALRALVRHQLEGGVAGLVACGSTGEAAGLLPTEHELVVRTVVDEVMGRVPVLAGVGDRSTHGQIWEAKRSVAAGADALLVVTPAYVKPTQAGLEAHFRAVAQEAGRPIVLYNVPGRSAVDMQDEVVARLAQVPGIVGLKDATGSLDRAAELRRLVPDGFSLLSGDDPTLLAHLALGGDGAISVLSNVMPRALVDLWEAMEWGHLPRARTAFLRLFPLARALFVESNPIPVKTALMWLDILPSSELRLPLTPLSAASAERLEAAMRGAGLLPQRRAGAPSSLGVGAGEPAALDLDR